MGKTKRKMLNKVLAMCMAVAMAAGCIVGNGVHVYAAETEQVPYCVDDNTIVDYVDGQEVVMHKVASDIAGGDGSEAIEPRTVPITWVGSTAGLGSGYKKAIENYAESVKLHLGQRGSLYYASRQSDWSGYHRWYCKIQLSTVHLYYGINIYTMTNSSGQEYVAWASDPWEL